MKVLVIGQDYADSFASLIADAFSEMGHESIRFDPAPRPASSILRIPYVRQALAQLNELRRRSAFGERRFVQQIASIVERNGPFDLVLCTHDFLMPRMIVELKRHTSAPVALWYPDHVGVFGSHGFLNAPFDAMFFKDPYLVAVLKQILGTRIYYLPECFSPSGMNASTENVLEEDAYRCDVAIAGNVYAYRIEVFKRLSQFKIKIWGNPPPRWAISGDIQKMLMNRYVTGAEKAKVFRSARVALNSLHPGEVWGINARAFEVAGAGGFQLIDWRPGLSQLFDDGTELVSFSNFDDLVRKIDYYLPREDERRRIAIAGQRRATSEHTYRHRLDMLLDTVFGDADGFPIPRIGCLESSSRVEKHDASR